MRLKALIVDDDKSIRRFPRGTLMTEGYDVVESEMAAVGLRLATETRPDLVVLDLGFPFVSRHVTNTIVTGANMAHRAI